MSKLNARQSRFVDEYLIDLNATQAAIRAGYSARTSGRTGHENLKKPEIEMAIQARMQDRSEKVGIDADYVLSRLHEIDQLDIGDILDDTGNVLPVKQWPKAWRRSISGADLMEMQTGDVMTVVRKLKWPDKTKVLDLIGKHTAVSAWTDRDDDGEKGEPLDITFNVAPAVKSVTVTRGQSKEARRE